MELFVRYRFTGVLVAAALFIYGCSNKSEIPSQQRVAEAVNIILPTSHQVVKVTAVKDIPDLIEVVVKIDKQVLVFYLDKSLKYAFSGSLMEISTKKNLTADVQKSVK